MGKRNKRGKRQTATTPTQRPVNDATSPAPARRHAVHGFALDGDRVMRWIARSALVWGIVAVALAVWYLRQRYAAVGGIWLSTADLSVDGEATVESVRYAFFWILVPSSVVLFVALPLALERAVHRMRRGSDPLMREVSAGWLLALWFGLWVAQLLFVVAWFVPIASRLAGWEAVPPLILVPVAMPTWTDARMMWLAGVCLAAVVYELIVIELYMQTGPSDPVPDGGMTSGTTSRRCAAAFAVIGGAIPVLLAAFLYGATALWFSGD